MRRPASLGNKHTVDRFEFNELFKWVVLSGNRTNPKTNAAVPDACITEDNFVGRQIRTWCEERVAALQRVSAAHVRESKALAKGAAPPTPPHKVHVFVDDSNIMLGAKHRSISDVNVGKLARAMHRNRNIMEKHIAGSGPHKDRYWQRWKEAGYDVHEDPRRGKETFVDDVLGAQLAHTINCDFGEARIIALATGDGNDNNGRVSFPEHIQQALLKGWFVELYSWRSSTSSIYDRLRKTHRASGQQFKIFYLDNMDIMN